MLFVAGALDKRFFSVTSSSIPFGLLLLKTFETFYVLLVLCLWFFSVAVGHLGEKVWLES